MAGRATDGRALMAGRGGQVGTAGTGSGSVAGGGAARRPDRRFSLSACHRAANLGAR